MGATNFKCIAKGNTMHDAFISKRKEAVQRYGMGGYTGSIAEKQTFREVDLPKSVVNDPVALSKKIEELTFSEFDDKWGPAGCVSLGNGEYLFFGIAST